MAADQGVRDAAWEAREDWLSAHGLAPYMPTVQVNDDGPWLWECGECGSAVLNRHQHAEWHMTRGRG